MSWNKVLENPSLRQGSRTGPGLFVKTDDKWKDFVYGADVPKRVLQREFDYLDDADSQDGFFKYQNTWHHTSQFMRVAGGGAAGSGAPSLAGWDGYLNDSMSTGVVIKLSRDGEQYKVGTFAS